MNGRMYSPNPSPQEGYTVSMDLDGFVAWLESHTTHTGVLGQRLRDAVIRREQVGGVNGRTWKLSYQRDVWGGLGTAEGVVLWVTQLSELGAGEQRLWVEPELLSDDPRTVEFYNALLRQLGRVALVQARGARTHEQEQEHQTALKGRGGREGDEVYDKVWAKMQEQGWTWAHNRNEAFKFYLEEAKREGITFYQAQNSEQKEKLRKAMQRRQRKAERGEVNRPGRTSD